MRRHARYHRGVDPRKIWIVLVGVALTVTCIGLGAFWIATQQDTPAAPPSSRDASAGTIDEGWHAYQTEWLSRWQQRLHLLSDEDQEMIAALREHEAHDPEAERRTPQRVDGLLRDRIVDEFLAAAFGSERDASPPPAAGPGMSMEVLAKLRQEHGAFVSVRTPRHQGQPRWKGERVRSRHTMVGLFEGGASDVEAQFVWSRTRGWLVDALRIERRSTRPDDPQPSGGPHVPVPEGDVAGDVIVRQTCVECEAIRFGHTGAAWQIAVGQSGREDCPHLWRRGASRGLGVRDGRVILVRNARAVGAFALRGQAMTPERTSVQWAFREDGAASLDRLNGAVESGSTEGVKVIAFGPFRVRWSGAGSGRGWLYYPRSVGEEFPADETRVCVTDATSLAEVDPFDEKWVYRASASDPGVRGRGD